MLNIKGRKNTIKVQNEQSFLNMTQYVPIQKTKKQIASNDSVCWRGLIDSARLQVAYVQDLFQIDCVYCTFLKKHTVVAKKVFNVFLF